jgi:predicted  nucleic acid-binding Zn-ribbon protein
MKRMQWMLLIIITLALAVPAGAQGCGGMRSMGMSRGCGMMDMDRGCGMMGMGGGMCGMCGGMMGSGSCNMMQGCPMTVMPYLEYLNLTDSQWNEVDQIISDFEDQIVAAREDAGMADPAVAFIQVFASPSLTVSSLEDFAERAAELSDEIRVIHDEALVRIHDVLTSDQLEELVSYVPGDNYGTSMARSGCGMGRMGGMGGGCRGMR